MASKARPSRGKAYAGGSRAAANEAALDDARVRVAKQLVQSSNPGLSDVRGGGLHVPLRVESALRGALSVDERSPTLSERKT
eukprot:1183859-Prorocentrum_minimum.AAC.1